VADRVALPVARECAEPAPSRNAGHALYGACARAASPQIAIVSSEDDRRPGLRERVKARIAARVGNDHPSNFLHGERLAEAGQRITHSVLEEVVQPEQLDRLRRAGEAAARGVVEGMTKNLPLAGYLLAFAAGFLTAGLLGPLRRRT
jgi:hypothetical protein